ncbi:MAG TPA: FliM/FliN family flagellar motor switch protein, partial [Spirochaetota bacterium]|nr:FliM/FliN family flagellar motor switch protein [Spirochaetota bacterium]
MSERSGKQETDNTFDATSHEQHEAHGSHSTAENNNVQSYNFRNPLKFTAEHINVLTTIHETFARLTEFALSSQLTSPVSVKVSSVGQVVFRDYMQSLSDYPVLFITQMEPLSGPAMFEMDSRLSFAIIERLLGGSPKPPAVCRELTDIELSLMEGIYVRMLGNLREAWSNVLDLRPRLGNIETSGQFAQIVMPNDIVLCVALEMRIGEVEAMCTLCLPGFVIQPVTKNFFMQKYRASWYNRKGLKQHVAATLFTRFAVFRGVPGKMTPEDMMKIKAGMKIPLSAESLSSQGAFVYRENTKGNEKNNVPQLPGQDAADSQPVKEKSAPSPRNDSASGTTRMPVDPASFSYLLSLRIEDAVMSADESRNAGEGSCSIADYAGKTGAIMLGELEIAGVHVGSNKNGVFLEVRDTYLPPNRSMKKNSFLADYALRYPCSISLEVGRTAVPVEDAASLGPGSIIELGTPAGGSCSVILEDYGVALGRAEAVLIDERFGMRISAINDAPGDGSGLSSVTADTHVVYDEPSVTVRCIMGRTVIAMADLLDMKEESFYALDRIAGSPFDVYVGNDLLLKGDVVVGDGDTLCLRIVDGVKEAGPDTTYDMFPDISKIQEKIRAIKEAALPEEGSAETVAGDEVREEVRSGVAAETAGYDESLLQLTTDELLAKVLSRIKENPHLAGTALHELHESNRECAAVLMVVLGVEESSSLMKIIDEPLMESLVFEMARLIRADASDGDKALIEYITWYDRLAGSYEGGIDYARNVLETAFGTEEAVNIVNRLTDAVTVKPFDFIRRTDPSFVLHFIQNEHPQTIAFVLSLMQPAHAAQMLAGLPQSIQSGVTKRIACMDRVTPDVVREVERVLERKLSTLAAESYLWSGGIDAAVEVLTNIDRNTEKTIFEDLEKEDPELAEAIK